MGLSLVNYHALSTINVIFASSKIMTHQRYGIVIISIILEITANEGRFNAQPAYYSCLRKASYNMCIMSASTYEALAGRMGR